MLEEKHNFKAWLYLSPALVLLIIFTFYPIFNAFNLLFMYNYDYMQQQRDGYTFYNHDPVLYESWAYREHWGDVLDIAVDPDGHVYSVSGNLSVHRTDNRRLFNGDFLSTDPEKMLLIADYADLPYDPADISAYFMETATRVYTAVYDADTDRYVVVQHMTTADDFVFETEHTDVITQIFATSANILYTASLDGTLRRYEKDNNLVEEVWVYDNHAPAAINAFAFISGTNFIYTASADGEVHKVDIRTGEQAPDGDNPWVYDGHTGAVLSISLRGSLIYSGDENGMLHHYNVNNVALDTRDLDAAIMYVKISRNNDAYMATADGKVHKYGPDYILRWSFETEDPIVAFNIDNEFRPGSFVGYADGVIEHYDTDGELLWRYAGHSDEIVGIFNDAHDRMHTAAKDGLIHRTIPLRVFTNFDSPVYSVAAPADGTVYFGLEDGTVRKLDFDAETIWTYATAAGTVNALAVDVDGNIYAATAGGDVHKIDEAGDWVWTYSGHTTSVNAVDVDVEGFVYTTSSGNEVHKIDEDGDFVWRYSEHTASVNGVSVDSDGHVYTASSDQTVHKISADGEQIWVFEGHEAAVNDVIVDKQGRIYSVSDDQTMRRLNDNGNEFWVYNRFINQIRNDIRVTAVTLDEEGNIYFGTAAFGTTPPTVRRVDENTRVPIFHNFMNTLRSDMFIRGLINTFIIVFVSVPVSVIISLLLSVWLNSIKRLQGFFQTVFFLPYVTNAIAIGMAFAVIFHRDYGLINYILIHWLGMSEGLNWLGAVSIDETASAFNRFMQTYLNLPMLSLLVFITWGGLAFKIMVFLSGLQSIDKQYYDAARIDSARRSRVFRRITIPLLSPMIAYITITSFIGAFKEYTAIVGMFGPSLGPPGDPDRLITIVGLVYKSLDEMGVPGRLSEAAATAIILFMLTLVLTLINMYISKKRVHY